ncbi:ABC transporter ATP-binding protein [Cumulibacter manganitolerans]|uniref:ABC transporter ATP-binding protein n=1 Tax=Cumulibacter manganitolerans TaxID=1884992 RepID=UPI001E599164|nr:ABC transporter ATP-binding protein [Cumulibacter manganitolerans]
MDDGAGHDEDRAAGLGTLVRLWPWVRPYRGQLSLMFLGALLATLAGLAIPVLTQRVIDGPIRHGDRAGLWWLGAVALAFGVFESAMIYLRRVMMSKAAIAIEADLRDSLYRHLQRLPVAFHDRWQSGQLLSRATTDLSAIRRFVGFGLVFFIVNVLTFAVVVVVLVATYWPLGLLVLASAVPLVWILYRFEKRYSVIALAQQDQQGELATDVEESATGIRILKSFGRAQLAADRYDAKSLTLLDIQLTRVNVLAAIWALIELHPHVVLSVLVLAGSAAVGSGAITLGTLVAFVSLFLILLWPIASLGFLVADAQQAATAAGRLFEVLDTEPGIVDASPVTGRGAAADGARLVFRDVSFRFPDSGRDVLHGIDLEVAPGETVAVVGPTGCGKTTLTGLVPRLYDVTGGAVEIDGVDVRQLALSDLRATVSMAFEDPTLFSASVRENLTLGRPDATEAQIAEALEVAQAGFVHALPWGLETRIGEQGMSLSGGQRQRLALARAVLGRPRLLVLDDPLSALDIHTEALVERALRRVLAQTTGIVVAHRPSTVLLADRVAFLVDGTIAAVGTHRELLRTLPAYRAILSADAEEQTDLEVTR